MPTPGSWFRGAHWVTLALCTSAVLGCARGDGLELSETTGRVMLGTPPVPSGGIMFVPDLTKGTAGPTGSGIINRDGSFRIVTANRDGALVGHHRIRITSYLTSPEDSFPMVTIAGRYQDERTSELTAEVKPGQPNVFVFELAP